ncbi:hypothetical protein GOP47_0011640 [Adiantum capillus-veneris]|uniref:Uncharacterized protein n=1 Tax=Adiantum capillus-veneris TaxID=13818 RepID=A0A9D4ZGY4_ADICA|nr:hypothetical protein GOP47_0011640 [Adiantum capillus-veneris]
MNGRRHNMGTRQRDGRDEDLALFHDMRRRERRNFLYLLADDVDVSPTATPTRTGRELLPLDSEKNDFDWLLTPPSTPLFPSLDQDGPIVNLSQRRVLTRSASVSRSARLSYPQEPSPKVIHGGNPSPKRPSTASSTSSTVSTCRGRPLSPSLTSRSSPTMRSSSPCRPVTPTGRNSTAATRSSSRSLTPTLRRNNTSPSSANRAVPMSGRSRGKSLSPKLGPWEPSLPGFSAEPPPNLRTSLSDRTFQRGFSHISKNKAKIRGSSAEMFDASSQSRWQADSPDGSGNWSLSYSNDHSSSQNSKASVVSYDDDVDMAESVLSGSVKSDSGSKRANAVTSKTEESSLRRSVLPAKRQMRSSGATGDAMPFLSLAARKSYERQAQVQRRNAQAMFRPLLSSAPVTSFYTSKPSGIHLRSSGLFMDSFSAQSSSMHAPRSEGLHVETATEAAAANSKCEQPAREVSLSGIQETIEEESECSLNSEEENLGCQSKYCVRDSEERLSGSKGQADNSADGHKLSFFSTAEKNKGLPVGNIKNLLTNSEGTCVLPAQYLKQGPVDDKAQHEDTSCAMDSDTSELSIPADSCVRGRHTYQGAEDHASVNTSTGQSKDIDLTSEESTVKENHAEDQKPASSGKAHPSYVGIGNGLSQHGSQRVLSDLGSFRKHSPMKGYYTRSHDGSLFGEKNGSCDSFMSDSHSLVRSLASALGSGKSADLESLGGAMVGNAHSESIAVMDTSRSVERVSSSLDRDSLKKGVPLCMAPTEVVDDAFHSDSEVSATCAFSTYFNASVQDGLHSLVTDLHEIATEASSSEVYSENPLVRVSTSDRSAQQDVLSLIGSCAPRITMLVDDAVQHGCTDAACTGQSGRYSDACIARRLAGETLTTDDPTLKQLPGVPLSKRSLTLEEATDTILFCSSIVHELVYKAATLSIENEEQKVLKPLVSKRDFVALFGFSGADSRSNGVKAAKPARNRKRQPLASTTVCETSSFVQKQRMVHRQTPAVTMRQSPMERIENAIMGNHEEMHEPTIATRPKRKMKQGKPAKCRCSCCMM